MKSKKLRHDNQVLLDIAKIKFRYGTYRWAHRAVLRNELNSKRRRWSICSVFRFSSLTIKKSHE